MMGKNLIIKSLLFVFLALFLLLSLFFWDMASFFHPDKIRATLASAGRLAPLIYMLIMALAIVISPIPSLPLNIAAGAFFGPIPGTLYSSLGSLFGAVVSFMIARALGRELIEPFLGGHINFCVHCSNKLLTKVVLFSRLLPVVSFDIVSYGAGLTKMSLKHFSVATLIGMLPLTFIYNYFGSVLIFGKGLTVALGLIMVILFFLVPHLIEQYDLFSMRKVIRHEMKDTNVPKGGSSLGSF